MPRCQVVPVKLADRDEWVAMRVRLWPEGGLEEHAHEADAYFAGTLAEPVEVLLARDEEGQPAGFAELSIRPWVDGCETRDVGYLEGWYVEPDYRRQGVGRALVEAAMEWARACGCREFASDTQLHNANSAAAHRALGFEEVERLILFRQSL